MPPVGAAPAPVAVARLPQVEVARVAAMGAIFLFHLWSAVPDGLASGWGRAALAQGHLGVVVFNVITGLVLAWPHVGPAGRPLPPVGAFVRHRFLRIVPAYWLALGLWAAVAALGPHGPSAADVVAHALFVHTLSPAYFFGIVPAYWWLGLLAQLYLAFPLLLRLARALGPGRAASLLCALGWGVWLALDALARAYPGGILALANYLGYYNLPYRLPEFAIGIALAGALRGGGGDDPPALAPATVAKVLALCGLGAALAGAAPARVPLVHVGLTAACVALFVVVLGLPVLARAVGSALVARLGVLSYGFYLMHQPILAHGAELLVPRIGPEAAFWMLLVGGGALGLAGARGLERVVGAGARAR